jgi:hypothetical protein
MLPESTTKNASVSVRVGAAHEARIIDSGIMNSFFKNTYPYDFILIVLAKIELGY